MTTQNKQASTIFEESDSDLYIRGLEQEHGYDHPLSIAARLEQNISLYGGENCTSLYMFEAMGALRKLAPLLSRVEDLEMELQGAQKVSELNLVDAKRYRALRDDALHFSFNDGKTKSAWIVLGFDHTDACPTFMTEEIDTAVDSMISALAEGGE